MKKFLFVLSISVKIVYIFFLTAIFITESFSSMIDCINVPTAEVVDYGIGELDVKLYDSGGTISRIIFAPFNRFNFGGSIDIDKMIGKQSPIIRDPQFYFKWRIFDGTKNLPALAIGYDAQGYEYNESQKKYLQPAKGLFLVFTVNIFTPGFFTDFGVNVVKHMEENQTFGFIGVRYTIENVLTLITEYENIGNNNINQTNAGFRISLSEQLNIDLVFKNLIKQRDDIEIDRQIRISYQYKFF
ncbi:MAG: hypothetical protein SNJ64_03365 [Endomicrobiia bacterium]